MSPHCFARAGLRAAAVLALTTFAAAALAAPACDRETVETDPGRAVAPCTERLAATSVDKAARAALLRLRAEANDRLARLPAALADHDAALELTPSDSDLHVSRAWTLWAMGRFADADAALRRAFDIKRTDPRANHMQGFIRMARGDHANAVVAFDEALRGDPRHAFSLNHRSQSLHALRRYSESLRDAEALLALGKPHLDRQMQRDVGGARTSMYADALYRRGKAFADLGRPQDALRDYLAAQAHGDRPQFWQSSAHVRYYDLKDDKGAFADMERLLERNPKDAYALKFYGKLLRGRDKFDQAVKMFDRLVAVEPHSAEAIFERGFTRKVAGDRVGAVKDYLDAYRMSEPFRVAQTRQLRQLGYLRDDKPPAAGSPELVEAMTACVIDPGCR